MKVFFSITLPLSISHQEKLKRDVPAIVACASSGNIKGRRVPISKYLANSGLAAAAESPLVEDGRSACRLLFNTLTAGDLLRATGLETRCYATFDGPHVPRVGLREYLHAVFFNIDLF